MFINLIGEAITFADRVIILTSRPSKVKAIYDIYLPGNSIHEKRKNERYNCYYERIWKDLDLNE